MNTPNSPNPANWCRRLGAALVDLSDRISSKRGLLSAGSLAVSAALIAAFALLANPKADKPDKPDVPKFSVRQELTLTRDISASNRGERVEFPAGTKAYYLKSKGNRYWVYIGEDRHQFTITADAIAEAGGTPGPRLENPPEIMGMQVERERAIVAPGVPFANGDQYWIYTGVATGLEDIPSTCEKFEQEIFHEINRIRTSRGLKALIWDEDLARAARYHAADCTAQNYMGHDTRDYLDSGYAIHEGYAERQARFMVDSPIRARGENIHRSGLVKRTVRGKVQELSRDADGGIVFISKDANPNYPTKSWMESAGHRENLLRAEATHMGIGYIQDIDTPWDMLMGIAKNYREKTKSLSSPGWGTVVQVIGSK